jgi:Flp pilus assembly protein TadG
MPKRPLTPAELLSPARLRLRVFGRDDRGATLIEFAILALPFFALMGAILETAIVFLAGQFLESAVQDSTRLILTGQAQNAETRLTAEDFRDKICDGLYGMFDCSKLLINVSVIDSFAAATASAVEPIDPTDPDEWTLAPTYNPGGRSDVVMVQAYYKWPTIFNFFGLNLANLPDGTRLLGAIRVFRNEPF